MDIRKMDKNKQFIIISLAIFGVITILSIVFFKTCSSEYCNFNVANTLNIIIITFGIIGLLYCFFLLRDFNTTIDKDLIQDYKKILDDSPDDVMKIGDIIDKDKENKNGHKTVSFFI